MSRWEELTKQPTAKFIHIYNQTDEYDNKGKRILISPRRTPDFDHFVDEVNDKLAPPGVGLRNIYTAQGGSPVRSVSALTVSKEYTASPAKYDKKFLKKVNKHAQASRKNSKKNSANSSDGYFSDGEFLRKQKAMPGRKTLMERQAEYARSRSPSPSDRSRSTDRPFTPSNRFPPHGVSPQRKAKSPSRTTNAGKTPPARQPISRRPKKTKSSPSKKLSKSTGKKSSFNKRGYNKPELAAAGDSDREQTPPGKRRVAFKGQYLFITDDEESEEDDYSYDGGKSMGKSKKSIQGKLASKRSSIYSKASNYSSYSKVSKAKSKASAKSSNTQGGDSDEYSYDSDDKSTYDKSKRSTAKSTAKSRLKNSSFGDNSRITEEDSDEYSDYDASYDKSRKSTAKSGFKPSAKPSPFKNNLTVSNAGGKSRRSTAKSKTSARSGTGGSTRTNSDYGSDYSDESRAGSRVSKYSKYSKYSKASGSGSGSGSDSYYSGSPDRAASRAASRKGASRKSSVSGASGTSTASSYNASSRNSGARTVPDSAETKVNTPVDMKKAKEVSSNASGSESHYSDDYSYDKSTKKP